MSSLGGPEDPAVGMHTEGVITRSMRDTAALLDAIVDDSGVGPLAGPAAASAAGRRAATRHPGGCASACACAPSTAPRWTAAAPRPRSPPVGSSKSSATPSTSPRHRRCSTRTCCPAPRTLLAVHAAHELDRWSATLGRPLGADDVEPLDVEGRRGGPRRCAGRACSAPDPPAAAGPRHHGVVGEPSTCS